MYLNSNKKVDIKTGTCVLVFFGFVKLPFKLLDVGSY